MIEAENYDAMVGMVVMALPSASGGFYMGYIDAEEWLRYDVDVIFPGTYLVTYRVASVDAGQIQLKLGDIVLATTDIPNSGDWANWFTVTVTIELDAGPQALHVYVIDAGFNFDWLEFTQAN